MKNLFSKDDEGVTQSVVQCIGQRNLDVGVLFKANEKQVTSQVKTDATTGLQERILQFTTLDINKMIHEASAEEETEALKLTL